MEKEIITLHACYHCGKRFGEAEKAKIHSKACKALQEEADRIF
jgi:hypothetical protein